MYDNRMNAIYNQTAPVNADDGESHVEKPVQPDVTEYESRPGKSRVVDKTGKKIDVKGYPSTEEEIQREDIIGDVEDKRTLWGVEARAHTKLLSLQTVFPFDILPNTIGIDENKVDIMVRRLFHSEQLHSLLISDIKSVTVTASVIFASRFFEVEGYETNPPVIPYIWKADAYTARDIIQGLITCNKEGIDVSKFNDENITERLKSIGQVQT
jgi:hypothetical protein